MSTLSRRNALKWLAGSSAAAAAIPAVAAPNETEPVPAWPILRSPLYDPDFSKKGAVYDLLLTPEEIKTTTVLADLLLPKDDLGPAASECGVAEFINEWVSAPWPEQTDDREIVRGGIAWLNTESFRRTQQRFDETAAEKQEAILDDISGEKPVTPEHKTGALFFKTFRRLCISGYYTHPTTWKQLGYVGNVTIGGPYPGPPLELIKQLGLEDVA